MDNHSERINVWLHGFYNHVRKTDAHLLPLYGQRIHFFPRQDKDDTINFGLDDLHEPYTDAATIKRMRELFEEYAANHDI